MNSTCPRWLTWCTHSLAPTEPLFFLSSTNSFPPLPACWWACENKGGVCAYFFLIRTCWLLPVVLQLIFPMLPSPSLPPLFSWRLKKDQVTKNSCHSVSSTTFWSLPARCVPKNFMEWLQKFVLTVSIFSPECCQVSGVFLAADAQMHMRQITDS